MKVILRYFAQLSARRLVLWCYLVWYLASVTRHFTAEPRVWLNAAGIAVVVGIGLTLSVVSSPSGPSHRWQRFRLFLIPFCVSSFSALIKDRGFLAVFSPNAAENLGNAALVLAFVLVALVLKQAGRAHGRRSRSGGLR